MSGEAPEDSSLPDAAEVAPAERAVRTNLLLSGTIEAADLKGPVRIRNLSETGALLEGPTLPAVGQHLVLRRLQMEIGAAVMWLDNSRCGVKFDGSISVSGWREGNWIAPVVTAEQARIDSIQAALRAGAPPEPSEARHARARLSQRNVDVRIASELIALRGTLEKTGEMLSEEPAVVEHYAETLQNFDIACQILGHLAAVLTAEDRGPAVHAIGMEELRQRLERNGSPGS